MASVEVTFRPDRGGIDRLLQDPYGPYGQWLARRGNTMTTVAKQRANVDTGLMRSRVEFRVETEGGLVIGVLAAKTGYAKFVHDGTRYSRGNPFLTDAVRDTLR